MEKSGGRGTKKEDWKEDYEQSEGRTMELSSNRIE